MAEPAGQSKRGADSSPSRAPSDTGRAGNEGSPAAREVVGLEPLQPQELAITLLGAFARAERVPLWSGGLVRLLGEFGFSSSASRAVLARLVRRELLSPSRSGRLVFYDVTARCDELLDEGERRIFSLGRNTDWDGSWTVVWHSIPEPMRVERGRFGRRLRFFGFGSVQDGTWISPHNREDEVRSIVDELGLQPYVGVLIGRPAVGLQIDRVIERGWDLAALSRRYERFVSTFRGFRGRPPNGLDDRSAFLARTCVVHAFRQFPFMDPDLPGEVMPNADARNEAIATFHSAYEWLREPAQRHFTSVAIPPRG